MSFTHLDRIRREIEAAKSNILSITCIKSIEDYRFRSGYLTGLEKAAELFKEQYLRDDLNDE